MTACRHLLPVVFLLILSCATKDSVISSKNVASEEVLNEKPDLATMLTGSYDSSAQAAEDSSYFDISLHMYPIWTSMEDAKYLYVEQSVTSMPDKPYRQRIYRITENEAGKFISEVYAIDGEERFIGKWKEPAFFKDFGKDIMVLRDGCAVYMNPTDEGYSGATQVGSCGSTLRGASFATSVVTVTEGRVESWDQGFDTEGKQVWGAVDGPYVFMRK